LETAEFDKFDRYSGAGRMTATPSPLMGEGVFLPPATGRGVPADPHQRQPGARERQRSPEDHHHTESLQEGFADRVFDASGVKRFVNVYVNEDNIRDRKNMETELKAGDTISILPSIAGGAAIPTGCGVSLLAVAAASLG